MARHEHDGKRRHPTGHKREHGSHDAFGEQMGMPHHDGHHFGTHGAEHEDGERVYGGARHHMGGPKDMPYG